MNFKDVVDFAVLKHGSQAYDIQPYKYHLDKVLAVIDTVIQEPQFKWLNHEVIRAAAYLHDIIEDTNTSWQEICDPFGDAVADLVQLVSDEPGKNRKDRKLRTYPKIKAGGLVPKMIKLADRIANVEYSLYVKNSRFNMYFREQSQFIAELYDPNDGLQTLWNRLNACFVPPENV